MEPAQHHFGITGLQAADAQSVSALSVSALSVSALFVSTLQCSQAPTTDQIRQAVEETARAFGWSGCAGRVAQEFGDHPETAAARMRWARQTLAGLAFRVRLAA